MSGPISGVSSGAAQVFQFRVVKNDSPMSDGVLAERSFNGTVGAVNLQVPVTAVTGDRIRPQVAKVAGAADIDITQLSLEVD